LRKQKAWRANFVMPNPRSRRYAGGDVARIRLLCDVAAARRFFKIPDYLYGNKRLAFLFFKKESFKYALVVAISRDSQPPFNAWRPPRWYLNKRSLKSYFYLPDEYY